MNNSNIKHILYIILVSIMATLFYISAYTNNNISTSTKFFSCGVVSIIHLGVIMTIIAVWYDELQKK